MKKIILLCSAVSSLVCAANAPWPATLTASKPILLPPLTPVAAHYTLSWNGKINAGNIKMIFNGKGSNKDESIMTASGGSTGVAAKLFPYTFSLTTKLRQADYSPIFLHANETDKKETLVTHVDYTPTQVKISEISRPHSTGKDVYDAGKFNFSPCYDVFSAMLYIRSQKLETGDVNIFVVHPFRAAHLCKVTVLGREKLNGKNAIKLDVQLQKIAKNMTLKEYKKVKTTHLWISDDTQRLPLEIRADAFIGDVRVSLEKTENL